MAQDDENDEGAFESLIDAWVEHSRLGWVHDAQHVSFTQATVDRSVLKKEMLRAAERGGGSASSRPSFWHVASFQRLGRVSCQVC